MGHPAEELMTEKPNRCPCGRALSVLLPAVWLVTPSKLTTSPVRPSSNSKLHKKEHIRNHFCPFGANDHGSDVICRQAGPSSLDSSSPMMAQVSMPLKKGSKIEQRTPELLRTRSDSSLSRQAIAQIIIDLESPPFSTTLSNPAADIVRANPNLYGDPADKALVKAVGGRVQRLRELKGKDPEEYWQVSKCLGRTLRVLLASHPSVRRIHSVCVSTPFDEDKSLEEEASHQEQEDEEEEEEELLSPSRRYPTQNRALKKPSTPRRPGPPRSPAPRTPRKASAPIPAARIPSPSTPKVSSSPVTSAFDLNSLLLALPTTPKKTMSEFEPSE